MPIYLERISDISGNYTPEEKEILLSLTESFRLIIADDDATKNILNKQKLTYTNKKIISLLERAVSDINVSAPMTKYSLFDIYFKSGEMLIVKGAVIFALLSEGLLQTKNQTNFNDSGLSINFFDKTPLYQSWLGMLVNDYLSLKNEFKSSVIASSPNSGFYGVTSEFGYGPFAWWR